MIYLLQIAEFVLTVVWWIIIAHAILSWLLAFNVVNMSNQAVRQGWYALGRMTDPIYNPIRRVLPDFGALDLSPLVALLVVGLLDRLVKTAMIQQVYPA